MRYAKAVVPDGPGAGLAFSEFCAQNVPLSLACVDQPESQCGSAVGKRTIKCKERSVLNTALSSGSPCTF